MISKQEIVSGGSVADYMESSKQAEYYSGQDTPSAWHGEGARIQGLEGQAVTREELIKQIDGHPWTFDKETGVVERATLTSGRPGEEHNCGVDWTFSAPKSVSIEAEMFGNDDVRQAHENAVLKTMAWVEQQIAETRIAGERVHTGNLTYAVYEHATSREGDMQTHSHVLITNTTYDQEGNARSLANQKLYDIRMTADTVYKMELGSELNNIGLKTEYDRNGNVEIAGYTREDIEFFSKRTAQRDEYLEEHGIDAKTATSYQKKEAVLETRNDKSFSDIAADNQERWQAERPDMKQAEREPVTISRESQLEAAHNAVGAAIDHLSEREASFSMKSIQNQSAIFAQGQTNIDFLENAIKAQLKSGELVERADHKFTTKDAVDAEKSMGKKLVDGIGAHESTMTDKEFDKALEKFEQNKGFKLSDEQVSGAKQILQGKDENSGLQGLPGTGKTTLFEFVNKAATDKGWEVKGISAGGAQAAKLQQETGIKSQTAASFIIDVKQATKDAELASKALTTLDKQKSSFFAKDPDFKKLYQDAKAGKNDVTVEFDSNKRAYYTDKKGDTFTADLYKDTTSITSKNVNHLGLTETEYVCTEKGVFKSGGSLKSELAGYLKEKLSEHSPESFLGKMAQEIGNKLLTENQEWRKVGGLEALTVRALVSVESAANKNAAKNELMEQASSVNQGNTKTILIHDEAGQVDQKTMNAIMKASETIGAKTMHAGDKTQLASVNAGTAFAHAQEAMPTTEMRDIQRQQTAHLKEAVSAIVNEQNHAKAASFITTIEVNPNQAKVREEFAKIESPTKQDEEKFKKSMTQAEKLDNKEVIENIAKRYADLPDHVNKFSVDKLNEKIEGKDYLVTRRDENGKADRIEFMKDDKELGVKAGEKGTIPTLPGGRKSDDVVMEAKDTTIITTATNKDRHAINETIRENLKEKGELQDGKDVKCFEKVSMTPAEKQHAFAYEKGQTIEFTKDRPNLNIEKGERFTIDKVESSTNTIFMTNQKDGMKMAFNPEKEINPETKRENFQTFKTVEKEFAVGERVAFTNNDIKNLDVLNGQSGIIEKFDGKTMTIKMNLQDKDGKDVYKEIDTSKYSHVTHAYGLTVNKAQGQSEGLALEHKNTAAGGGGHGQNADEVSKTRAKHEVETYTQNNDKAVQQSGRKIEKTSAMDSVSFKDYVGSLKAERGLVGEKVTISSSQTDKESALLPPDKHHKSESEVSRTEQPNSSGKENKEIRQRQQMEMER